MPESRIFKLSEFKKPGSKLQPATSNEIPFDYPQAALLHGVVEAAKLKTDNLEVCHAVGLAGVTDELEATLYMSHGLPMSLSASIEGLKTALKFMREKRVVPKFAFAVGPVYRLSGWNSRNSFSDTGVASMEEVLRGTDVDLEVRTYEHGLGRVSMCYDPTAEPPFGVTLY